MTLHSTAWIDIGGLDDIPRRGARVLKSPGGCIAVFRTATDEVYALDDKCPHNGGPLSEGIVHGSHVTCPLHSWVFDLASGLAQGADDGSVRTYRLKLEAGRILFDAGALAKPTAL